MTALTGVRVVELANERIALAGKLLADMGADVILVEPPEGDPSRGYPPFLDDEPGENRSLYWWHYHTSKRSVVIDLESQQGGERFRNLIASADMLIEAELPTRLAQLGLDYAELTTVKGDLIHVAVTSHGRQSPKSDLPATDLTILATSGPVWSCGYDDHALPPIRGPQQGYHTASHFAVMSALTALVSRTVSAQGQFIDVSMTAASNVTTEAATFAWLVAGRTVQRQTGRHAQALATRETQLLCGDGRYVNTGVPLRFPEEFGRLHGWLKELGLEDQLPEVVFLEMGANWEGAFEPGQVGVDDTITAIYSAGRDAMELIAANVTAQEFFLGCQRSGLAAAPVNSAEEAFEDEHFKARGFQVPVYHEHVDRTVVYPGAPFRFEKTPWAISRRAPRLGEHTEEVFDALSDD